MRNAIPEWLQEIRKNQRKMRGPRCISSLGINRGNRVGQRDFYIRVRTWLVRFLWQAFGAGRELESQLIAAEVHYIRDHLQRHRPGPCPECTPAIRDRFRR